MSAKPWGNTKAACRYFIKNKLLGKFSEKSQDKTRGAMIF